MYTLKLLISIRLGRSYKKDAHIKETWNQGYREDRSKISRYLKVLKQCLLKTNIPFTDSYRD
jgi:hypothetical protein